MHVAVFELLERADRTVASWSPDGKSFVVIDRDIFTRLLNPQRRSTTFDSFRRRFSQLGFKRQSSGGKKRDSFQHSFFMRGRPDLLKHIKEIPKIRTPARTIVCSLSKDDQEKPTDAPRISDTNVAPILPISSDDDYDDDTSTIMERFDDDDRMFVDKPDPHGLYTTPAVVEGRILQTPRPSPTLSRDFWSQNTHSLQRGECTVDIRASQLSRYDAPHDSSMDIRSMSTLPAGPLIPPLDELSCSPPASFHKVLSWPAKEGGLFMGGSSDGDTIANLPRPIARPALPFRDSVADTSVLSFDSVPSSPVTPIRDSSCQGSPALLPLRPMAASRQQFNSGPVHDKLTPLFSGVCHPLLPSALSASHGGQGFMPVSAPIFERILSVGSSTGL